MNVNSMRIAIVAAALACPYLLVTAEPAADGLWTDPKDPTLPVDFKIQGEYEGKTDGGEKFGAQVIALGGDRYHAVLYPGGLPGAGWEGQNRILLDGKRDGELVQFEPAAGERRYLHNDPSKFSATRQFPPKGQKAWRAVIGDYYAMSVKTDEGKTFTLGYVWRKADTLGAKPPKGAVVLFDGTKESMDNWQGGRLDEKTKLLNTDGHDIKTKQSFNNYIIHVEFMLPFKPAARGQGRGNSGFYQVDMYEVQVLDSFGLEGVNNECGGIYSKKDSDVNACLPPLQWQAYDIEFRNAVAEGGKKVKNARITAKLNGITIHDDYEIPGKTGGSRNEPEGTPGPIKLQGHGNPLQYRNIWIKPMD